MRMRTDGRRRDFRVLVVGGVLALAMMAAVVSDARACGHRRGGGAYHYNGSQGYYSSGCGNSYAQSGYGYNNGYGSAQNGYGYNNGYGYVQNGYRYANGQPAQAYYGQQGVNTMPVASTPAYEAPPAPTTYNSAYTAPRPETTAPVAPTQEPVAAPAPPAPPAPTVPR